MDILDEIAPSKRGRGRPRAQAAVLTAALELIAQSPEVRSITMEAIAEQAGISKVTLYRRWPSKAALMADALLRQLSESIPLDATKPPMVAITEHVHSLSEALEGKIGQLFRIVAAECMVEPAAMEAFRDRYIGPRRRAVTQIISRGLKDGSFTSPNRAVDCHDALYGALFYRFLFGFDMSDPAALQRLLIATLQVRPAGRG